MIYNSYITLNTCHSCGSRNPISDKRIDSHFRGNDNVSDCHSCGCKNPVSGGRVDRRFQGNDSIKYLKRF